ncbi:MAG: hypothetical protein BWY09_00107 [Candidatus Hydrogenedentes bacterium ADurb.Bin179]|nr:MAG: hypothetical protein BWY09_00107 [Candidatus Hydrogenedentes bacterium ADurb.Bin179]
MAPRFIALVHAIGQVGTLIALYRSLTGQGACRGAGSKCVARDGPVDIGSGFKVLEEQIRVLAYEGGTFPYVKK